MNKLMIVLVVVSTFCLSGCGDKEAREYARRLIPVVDTYQHELTTKINAEEKSYQQLARAYVRASKDDVMIRLASERLSRATATADTIVDDGKIPTRSEIIGLLKDYAKSDFDLTRSLFQEGMDSRSRFLTDLENLEIELQRVKLLKEALTELAKPDSDVKRLKAAAESLAKTKGELDKLLSAETKSSPDPAAKTAAHAGAGDTGKKTNQ